MKRSHSMITIQNLAKSLKNSIDMDLRKAKNPSLLKPSRSTIQLKQSIPRPHPNNTNISNSHQNQHCQQLLPTQKQNKIYLLQCEMTNLHKSLQSTKTNIKNYSKQLDRYEELTSQVRQKQEEIKDMRSMLERVSNWKGMIKEEIGSWGSHLEGLVAEKEYYEELVEAYCRQYKSQSAIVMKILATQHDNVVIAKKVQNLTKTLKQKQSTLSTWKSQTKYDLKLHLQKSKENNQRIQLISSQDKCDEYCQQLNLKRIRQLYCLFYGKNCKEEEKMEAEGSGEIDLWVCRKGLVEDFRDFVEGKIGRNCEMEVFRRYFNALRKIQATNHKTGNHQKQSHTMHHNQVKDLQTTIQTCNRTLQINFKNLQSLESSLSLLLAEQTLPILEYLHKEKHKNQITLIKLKLKQIKRQQSKRIEKIRQSYCRIYQLEDVIEKVWEGVGDREARLIRDYQRKRGEEREWKQALEKVHRKLTRLKQQKQGIEHLISEAVSKWKTHDETKSKLKSLAKQLNTLSTNISIQESTPTITFTQNLQQSISFKNINNINQSPQFSPPHKDTHKKSIISSLSRQSSYLKIGQSRKMTIDDPFKKVMGDCKITMSRKVGDGEVMKISACLKQSNLPKQSIVPRQMKKTVKQSPYSHKSNKQNKSTSQKTSKYSLTLKQTKLKIPKTSQRQSLSNLLINKLQR